MALKGTDMSIIREMICVDDFVPPPVRSCRHSENISKLKNVFQDKHLKVRLVMKKVRVRGFG